MTYPTVKAQGERAKKNLVLSDFRGVNLQAIRQSIGDTDAAWIENYLPIGFGNMKVVPGQSSSLATLTGETVYYTYPAAINGVDYIYAVCISGAAYEVNLTNFNVVTVGPAGTFSSSGVSMAQWENAGVLIIDPVQGYFDWNITAPATLTSIDPATVGTAISTYAGRVWIANGRTVVFTDTASYNSFGGAGGAFTISDETLHNTITALFTANNFLYIFGDDSIDILGDVRVVSGITQFTRQNITASIGTQLPNTIFSYYRQLMFAGSIGFYALSGATPQKISDNLDRLYPAINQATGFSGGQVSIYNILCAAFLFTFADSFTPTGGNRSLLAVFFNGKWCFASQGPALKLMVSVPVNGVPTLFAWDQNKLYRLFQDTTANVNSRWQSKLYDGQNPIVDKQVLRVGVSATFVQVTQSLSFVVDNEYSTFSTTVDADNTITFTGLNNNPIQFQSNTLQNINFTVTGWRFLTSNADVSGGKYIGCTINSSSAGLIINQIAMEYEEAARWR